MAAEVEAVIAAIGDTVESLAHSAALVSVTRERGEAHVEVTPERASGAAPMRILVPDTGRDMIFGAGADFRLEGLELRDVLRLCQGVLAGGFVEHVFVWRGRIMGTRGCIGAEGGAGPICESGNLGCFPPFLLRVVGAREQVMRYPSYTLVPGRNVARPPEK